MRANQRHRNHLVWLGNQSNNTNNTDCERCDGNYTAVTDLYDTLSAGCQGNADVVDQYRRLLFFWADRNCTKQNVSRQVMYIVITLAVGESTGRTHSVGRVARTFSTPFVPGCDPPSHPDILLLDGVRPWAERRLNGQE